MSAQRAVHIAERKRIYEILHPEAKHGAAPVGRGGKKEDANFAPSFAEDTANKTGQSKRKVQLDAQRGEEIGAAELAKLIGTSLDKGEELDARAKMDEALRKALIDKAASAMCYLSGLGLMSAFCNIRMVLAEDKIILGNWGSHCDWFFRQDITIQKGAQSVLSSSNSSPLLKMIG